MVSPRSLLGGVAASAAAVLLSAVLTGSAGAATGSPGGCSNENSGAAGVTCTNVGSGLYPSVAAGLNARTGVHLGADTTSPDCATALQTLNADQAKKQQDDTDLAADQGADGNAREKLAKDQASDLKEDTDLPDAGITAAQGELDKANGLAADTGGSTTKADAIAKAQGHLSKAQADDAKEDGLGVTETPADDHDNDVTNDHTAIDGANGTAAKLEAAKTADKEAGTKVGQDQSVVNTACAGQQGPPGPQGNPGDNGKDGIDAQIILSPGVCAEARVQPGDVLRLIRVVVVVPCPAVTPPAPATPPVVGGPVVVCPPRTPPPCQQCTTSPPVFLPPSNGNPGPVLTLPAPSSPDTSQVGTVPSGSVSNGGGSMAGQLPGTSR